jgi:hypothetical protein
VGRFGEGCLVRVEVFEAGLADYIAGLVAEDVAYGI